MQSMENKAGDKALEVMGSCQNSAKHPREKKERRQEKAFVLEVSIGVYYAYIWEGSFPFGVFRSISTSFRRLYKEKQRNGSLNAQAELDKLCIEWRTEGRLLLYKWGI